MITQAKQLVNLSRKPEFDGILGDFGSFQIVKMDKSEIKLNKPIYTGMVSGS